MLLFEQGEVDAAIGAVLHEVGMLGEVVVLAVLKHKDAVGLQKTLLHDKVGNLRQLLQGVGRVGKDKVILLPARLDEAKDVGAKTLNVER